MKILYTSDIHTSKSHLFSMLKTAEKQKAECIIIGGDIIPHHLPETDIVGILKAQSNYLRQIFIPALKKFRKKYKIPLYLDLGNDDFFAARKELEPYNKDIFHLLHMQQHELKTGYKKSGIDILGYMNVPPTPFGRKDWEKPDSSDRPYAPGNNIARHGYVSFNNTLEKISLDMSSDNTIEKELEQLSEMVRGPFVFVSHSPPYDTPLDVIYNGLHVGSLAIKRFIEKWSEKGLLIASLHGHIHESPERSGTIKTVIGNTLCINPGQNSDLDGDKNADLRYVMLKLEEDLGIRIL